MNAIEHSLATIQLGSALLTAVLATFLTYFLDPQAAKHLGIGAACVVVAYLVMWPFQLLGQLGGKTAVILQAVFIPIRLGILVALALYALDNIARPGAPFALGIALPVITGSLACLWISAKDPRYYWITLAKQPVLRTRHNS